MTAAVGVGRSGVDDEAAGALVALAVADRDAGHDVVEVVRRDIGESVLVSAVGFAFVHGGSPLSRMIPTPSMISPTSSVSN